MKGGATAEIVTQEIPELNIASIKNAGPEDSLMSNGGSVTSKAKR